jgi:hypothetical protein
MVPYHRPPRRKAKRKADFRQVALFAAGAAFIQQEAFMQAALILLSTALVGLSCAGYPGVSQATSLEQPTRGTDPSGIVSGLNGQAIGVMPDSGASRPLRIGDRVAVGEEIRVGPAASLELLWERRALFALEERTNIVVRESKSDAALVEVAEGTIRIAYSYNEGHPTDTLKIQTPGTRLVFRGGIVEAMVERNGGVSRTLTVKPGQTVERAGDLLRVIEGQAQVEPRLTGAKPFLLKAGYEFQATLGGSEAVRPSMGKGGPKLAVVDSHQQVPAPTVQRVVRVHVEHALEVERALSRPSRNANETEATPEGIKGAIVATSLGIPLSAISGTGGAIAAPSSVPSVSSGPVPGGLGPAAAPSVPAPIVQTPSVTALTPSQSGGINSLSLLQGVLQDVTRGRGRGRGRDRD